MNQEDRLKSLNEILIGGIEQRQIRLVEYDPKWPEIFLARAANIRQALRDVVVQIEHIGSTSVPGLAAKPIVDMLLVVADSGDEASYLMKMESAGYVARARAELV